MHTPYLTTWSTLCTVQTKNSLLGLFHKRYILQVGNYGNFSMYIHDALLRKKLMYLPLLVVTKVKKIWWKNYYENYYVYLQPRKNTI